MQGIQWEYQSNPFQNALQKAPFQNALLNAGVPSCGSATFNAAKLMAEM